jgi:hypothetical protein
VKEVKAFTVSLNVLESLQHHIFVARIKMQNLEGVESQLFSGLCGSLMNIC